MKARRVWCTQGRKITPTSGSASSAVSKYSALYSTSSSPILYGRRCYGTLFSVLQPPMDIKGKYRDAHTRIGPILRVFKDRRLRTGQRVSARQENNETAAMRDTVCATPTATFAIVSPQLHSLAAFPPVLCPVVLIPPCPTRGPGRQLIHP